MTNGIVVISPQEDIKGVGQDVWGDRWWQWNLPLPADKNPANFDDETDPRGRLGSLEKAQEAQDDDLFYIAGSFSSGDPFDVPNRTIIVPEERAVFLPVVNVNWRYGENGELGELEQIGEYPKGAKPLTPKEIRIINTAIIDTVKDPFVLLNGEPVTDSFPESFRQASPRDSDEDGKPGFSFILDGDVDESAAVGEGYWVGLEPLPPGAHTIQFGGVFDSENIDIDLKDPKKEGYVNTLIRSFGELSLDVTYNILNPIKGDNGKNKLLGTKGNDYIDGKNGQDVLLGFYGDDLIVGGNHKDIIDGGRGNDELWGDGGLDTFIFKRNYGNDKIFDFESGEVIKIKGFTEIPELVDIELPSGLSAVEVNFGNGDVLTFVGVELADDLSINLDEGTITL